LKKFSVLIFLVTMLSLLTGCTQVGAGHVGIKIYNSGSDKGVLDTPAGTGWFFYTPGQSYVVEFPTYVQTVKWTSSSQEGKQNVDESITFNTGNKMSVNSDVSLSYHLLAAKVPAFYVKFKTTELATFTDGILRNIARNCMEEQASAFTVDQLMSNSAPFVKASQDCLTKSTADWGIAIDQFGFIGPIRPPKSVLDSITETQQAAQLALKKQNELAQVNADVAKQIAAAEGNAKAKIAEAEGQAKANQIVNSSITANILEARRLDIQNAALYKWDGHLNETYVGGGGNDKLMINVPAPGHK